MDQPAAARLERDGGVDQGEVARALRERRERVPEQRGRLVPAPQLRVGFDEPERAGEEGALLVSAPSLTLANLVGCEVG